MGAVFIHNVRTLASKPPCRKRGKLEELPVRTWNAGHSRHSSHSGAEKCIACVALTVLVVVFAVRVVGRERNCIIVCSRVSVVENLGVYVRVDIVQRDHNVTCSRSYFKRYARERSEQPWVELTRTFTTKPPLQYVGLLS